MAKKVCEDMADLLLNERVTIVLDDQRTDAFVRQILQDNHFDTLGNEYQERKACSGTVAYVPCIEDLQSGFHVSSVPGILFILLRFPPVSF